MAGVSVVFVVVLVILGVLLLLAILGAAMASRRNALGAIAFEQSLAAVDRQLAEAVAADRGWERGALEASARAAFAERRPQTRVAELQLVQIVDEPGTDEDLAVFLVTAADGAETRLTLGRRAGAWYATALHDER
jgi:type II secretory pathway pseudopilin PulG